MFQLHSSVFRVVETIGIVGRKLMNPCDSLIIQHSQGPILEFAKVSGLSLGNLSKGFWDVWREPERSPNVISETC